MLLVVALGGNALLRRGDPLDVDVQRSNLKRAVARGLAPLARAHQLVITHGNGPQVGLLALQAAAYRDAEPDPLDVLGAESVGMIGYLIAQALANEVGERDVATLLTRVEVDAADPAFAAPTKPIGPLYSEDEMRKLAARHSWHFVREPQGFRRAVPSPRPRRIVELNAVRTLARAGMIVICVGGGGIPVVAEGRGLRGVEAVIDKDHSSALLAEEIGADALMLLTDVAAVWTRWPKAEGEPIGRVRACDLHAHMFDPGSMGPKVEAACRFVDRTGRRASIGAIEDAEAILQGKAGTHIEPGSPSGR
ncbi:MAG: carbamate kinase [Hyphomicrobiales bacterium]|nr:carbamate kinase [Hyphomicrobiales bacterium]